MGSNKYVGYVGGVAVAVGVGAAIAAASQGVASAETGKSGSPSASDSAKGDAGPKKSATGNAKHRQAGIQAERQPEQRGRVRHQVGHADGGEGPSPPLSSSRPPRSRSSKALFAGPASAEASTAATRRGTETTDTADTTATKTTTAAATINPATAFWNPFRWMPPEPAPQDMPGPIWTLEQSFMAIFPNQVKAVAREGFELGYRLTQTIPWVNIIIPFTNIITDLPNAFAGDKAAAQRVINNLIVTINPIAVPVLRLQRGRRRPQPGSTGPAAADLVHLLVVEPLGPVRLTAHPRPGRAAALDDDSAAGPSHSGGGHHHARRRGDTVGQRRRVAAYRRARCTGPIPGRRSQADRNAHCGVEHRKGLSRTVSRRVAALRP